MPFNSALVDSYFEKTFTLEVGAVRVWTFQAPSFPTNIIALEYASDAASGTDKMAVTLTVNADVRITGTQQGTPDSVLRFVAPDSTKSLNVAADATMSLTTSYGGTAANVLGSVVVVKMAAVGVFP